MVFHFVKTLVGAFIMDKEPRDKLTVSPEDELINSEDEDWDESDWEDEDNWDEEEW